MYEVTIRDIPAATALTVQHKGAYMQINRAFDDLNSWLAAHQAFRPGMRWIAIYYDNPSAVPEAELRSCAGVVLPNGSLDESPFDQAPFDRTEIPGGPYAVLRIKGPYTELSSAYQWLYGRWLPQSGKEVANVPPFEEYLNTPANTAPPELLTEICLPLRA